MLASLGLAFTGLACAVLRGLSFRLGAAAGQRTIWLGFCWPSRVHVTFAIEGQSLETKAGKTKDQLIPEMYGLKPEDLAFFAVHAVEDVYHVSDGLDLVSELCTTEKMQQEAIEAIHGTCDRFWRFFDGIQEAYQAEGHTLSEAAVA